MIQKAVEVFHQIEDHHHHAEHGQHEAKRPKELANDVTVQPVHVSDPLRKLNNHAVFPFPESARLNLIRA